MGVALGAGVGVGWGVDVGAGVGQGVASKSLSRLMLCAPSISRARISMKASVMKVAETPNPASTKNTKSILRVVRNEGTGTVSLDTI